MCVGFTREPLSSLIMTLMSSDCRARARLTITDHARSFQFAKGMSTGLNGVVSPVHFFSGKISATGNESVHDGGEHASFIMARLSEGGKVQGGIRPPTMTCEVHRSMRSIESSCPFKSAIDHCSHLRALVTFIYLISIVGINFK